MSNKLIDNKKLMTEWYYDKNVDLDPNNILEGSSKKAFWKCKKCGFIWEASIVNRFKGTGCPVCSNRITVSGVNDLKTLYPEVAKEWDYKLNKIDPSNINCHSLKDAYWICSKGHKWVTKINYRTYGGQGCPVCANLKIQIGYNDLKSQNGKLAKEWDYENNDLNPENVVPNSTYKAHWICSKGHRWIASVESRNRGNNCPYCAKEKQISFPEKTILFYIKKIYKDVIGNYRPEWLNGQEIDIYLPNQNIGIEYDGQRWHNNVERDLKKDNLCLNHGVKLFRVREKDCMNYDSKSIKIILENNNHSGLDKAIKKLINNIYPQKYKFNIDSVQDQLEIEQLIERNEKEKSLEQLFPNISKLWDYDKNGLLKPENYSSKSHIIVYWKCNSCHNSYKRSIKEQVETNGRCPICINQRIINGVNDFATKYPNLLLEWNYELNIEDPTTINLNGDKPVWWTCPNGHNYKATIYSRAKNNTGCPYCSGRFVIKGNNDLITKNLPYMKDWDYDKNKNIDPSLLSAGSSKKVWWICNDCGYQWQAIIKSRTNGNGCPMCSRKRRSRKLSKKVYQYDENNNLINVFDSTIQAEKITKIKHISTVCRGKRPRAGGYKWSYEKL